MKHYLQVKVDGRWLSLFYLNLGDLDANCYLYRDMRTWLRSAGVTNRIRLLRTTEIDSRIIESNRILSPDISLLIDKFCEIQVKSQRWIQDDAT